MDDRPQEEIEIENNFYEAEGVWKQDAERALIMFKRVVELEQSVSDKKFTFSSLTFIVLLTMQLGHHKEMIDSQKKLLSMANLVSKNEMADAIMKV